MKKFLIACFFIASSSIWGQVISPEDDGLVPKGDIHYSNTRVVPYPFLRQDDMMWATRHWERIQVQEKLNHPLYYPVAPLPDRKSMFDVLKDAILIEGSIVEVFRDDRYHFEHYCSSSVGSNLIRSILSWHHAYYIPSNNV